MPVPPGVHGRVTDLMKVSQKKYNLAVITVLGKEADAVVVEDSKAGGCTAVQSSVAQSVCLCEMTKRAKKARNERRKQTRLESAARF
jgi:hypothetical protein